MDRGMSSLKSVKTDEQRPQFIAVRFVSLFHFFTFVLFCNSFHFCSSFRPSSCVGQGPGTEHSEVRAESPG